MKKLIVASLLLISAEANAFVCQIIKLEKDKHTFKFRVTYGRFNNGINGGALKFYDSGSEIEFASIRECSEMTTNGFSCASDRWREGFKGLQVRRRDDGVYLVTAYTHYRNEKQPYYDLRDQECTVLQGDR